MEGMEEVQRDGSKEGGRWMKICQAGTSRRQIMASCSSARMVGFSQM